MQDISTGLKIKYFRELSGLTQNQLALKTGIHPVSIRKHETNRMVPQMPHIKKICEALNISIFILINLNDYKFSSDTGLRDFLCLLYELEFIVIDGERGSDGFIKEETFSVRLNDNLLSSVADEVSIPIIEFTTLLSAVEIKKELLYLERLNFWKRVGALEVFCK